MNLLSYPAVIIALALGFLCSLVATWYMLSRVFRFSGGRRRLFGSNKPEPKNGGFTEAIKNSIELFLDEARKNKFITYTVIFVIIVWAISDGAERGDERVLLLFGVGYYLAKLFVYLVLLILAFLFVKWIIHWIVFQVEDAKREYRSKE